VPLQFAELGSRSKSLTLLRAPGLCVDKSSAWFALPVADSLPGKHRSGMVNKLIMSFSFKWQSWLFIVAPTAST
jgi:hypothetical protein